MTMLTQRKHRLAAFTPAVLLALTIGIGACEEDADIDIINPPPGGVVGTVAVFADSTIAFNEYNTFSMPDTVVHFDPVTGIPLFVPRTHDQAVLDRVRANFIARGYTEELRPDSTPPDFFVLVGATATENRAAFISYPWYSTWGFYLGLGTGFDNSWTVVRLGFPGAGAAPATAGVPATRAAIAVVAIPAPRTRRCVVVMVSPSWGQRGPP